MQEREIKGITTELLCQAEFIKRKINVSVPVSPYCKYDFIADIDGTLYRIQVKYANSNSTGLAINTTSTHLSSKGTKKSRYSKCDTDFFCTIFEDECYLIPIYEIENRTQVTLTIRPSTHKIDHFMMSASDYLLDRQLTQIKNGDIGKKRDYIIQKCSKDGKVIGEFNTEKECALSCGNTSMQSHIHDCINGKRKSAYGFIWKRITQ
nr:MAG TPA: putative endonuclease [Bacteriophage sp.]